MSDTKEIEIACLYLASIEVALKNLTKELEAVKRLLKCEVAHELSGGFSQGGKSHTSE